MLHSFTKKYIDNSTKDGFQFVFFCDLCGKPYETVFRKSVIQQMPWYKKVGKKYGLELEKERHSAFFFANDEAKVHFNRCTCCGAYVCDDDYNAESGMCTCCSPEGLDTLENANGEG